MMRCGAGRLVGSQRVGGPGRRSPTSRSPTPRRGPAPPTPRCAPGCRCKPTPPGPHPVATPTVAVDARLSEVASAQYLLNRLDLATPPPLRRRSTPSPTICWMSRPCPGRRAQRRPGLGRTAPRAASAHSGSVQTVQICLHRGTYFETGTSTACCRRSTRLDVSSPKLQCESGRPARGSSRPTLRTPASARHPLQSSTGRDSGGAMVSCPGEGCTVRVKVAPKVALSR